ncbi:MAG: monomeric [FeFe] hydrogenase [Candidatus Gastranaerophilales bacterium]|nr:monomeric [FeFe] hydrogenase [Candidatus Gastranaerophilales bacterium]
MSNNSQAIHIKKDILVRIVTAFFSDDFEKNINRIPVAMRPKGSETPFRCCIHSERAIIRDRVIADLGFAMEDDDEIKPLSEYAKEALEREAPDERPLTVLEDACKGCVPSKIYVTDICKGCVARPCQSACRFDAISMKDGRSFIDGNKCKGCKMCISACPYNAIVKLAVPCEDACPTGAVKKNQNGRATIDYDGCISCGKCVASCPFGAIHEKSQLIDVLKQIKSENKVVAMFAPSIAGQFPGNIRQLETAIIKSGFDDVYEVALGADVTTRTEGTEFEERIEKGEAFMTTSCCAGYNELVGKHLPELKPFVSTTHTPAYYTAEIVRKKYPDAKLVFISPCVAKRREVFDNPKIDYVLNTEELGALFVGRKIEIMDCEERVIEQSASKQSRNYAVSGGVAGAVRHVIKNPEKMKPCIINGITKETIRDLRKYAQKGICPDCNIIEVMCCEGGCIGGNATINNERSAKKIIDNLLKESEDL